MRVRAAVLEEFGTPLVVQDVELAEPKARRGARPHRGVRRLPHRPLHGLRRRPDRLRAVRPRPRGSGRRRAGRDGRDARRSPATTSSRSSHPSAASASTACSPRTNRCIAIRDQQGRRLPARRHDALRADGEPIRHFMGTSTFAEYTVMPEIALAKVDPGGAARGLRTVRVRPLDRDRRRALHGYGRSRARRASSSVAASSGSVPSSAAASRAQNASSRSTSPRSASQRRDDTARPTHGSPPTTRSTGSAPRPAATAPTTRSRRPATSTSCSRQSRRRARRGASRR